MIRTMGVSLRKDRNNDRRLELIPKMVLGVVEKLTLRISTEEHCVYTDNTLPMKTLLSSVRESQNQSQPQSRNTPMFPYRNYNIRIK